MSLEASVGDVEHVVLTAEQQLVETVVVVGAEDMGQGDSTYEQPSPETDVVSSQFGVVHLEYGESTIEQQSVEMSCHQKPVLETWNMAY